MTAKKEGARPKRKNNMTEAEYRKWFRSKLKPDKDGCLIWTMGTVAGYGYLKDREGKRIRAHREAWRLEHGRLPTPPKQLNHRCHKRACCNTDCLYEGTPQENTDDMIKADRHVYGERAKNSKLTNETVAEIRIRRKAGEKIVDLAREFGVDPGQVSAAATGKAWPHVEEPPAAKVPHTMLTTAQKVSLWLLLELGVPAAKLAGLVGCSVVGIRKNRRTLRETWFPVLGARKGQ